MGGQIEISSPFGNATTQMSGTYVRSARPLCLGDPRTLVLGWADNDEAAYVDITDGVFTLDSAVFHEGPVTFVASIDPSPCEPM